MNLSVASYAKMLKKRTPAKILITAGPTVEPIDPVRFISNRSTGYMGYKLAELACKRKHVVTLISGPTNLKIPKVKKFIQIETAEELAKALKREIRRADCLIMCAAVSDFKPASVCKKKIKRKKDLDLKLIPNKDILKALHGHKKGKFFIGFSLETESLLGNASLKLKDKGLDLIVANRLDKSHNPFGNNKLDVHIIDKKGNISKIHRRNKAFIAHVLLDKIEDMWY